MATATPCATTVRGARGAACARRRHAASHLPRYRPRRHRRSGCRRERPLLLAGGDSVVTANATANATSCSVPSHAGGGWLGRGGVHPTWGWGWGWGGGGGARVVVLWLWLWLCGRIVGAVLLSGIWKPGIEFTVYHVHVELQNVVRDVLLVAIAGLSWKFTDLSSRLGNGFSWFPILEVGKLFAGIFITIIPAIAILKAGTSGALEPIVSAVTGGDGQPVNTAYFWLTGILSSFLDNAPTYLVFFNTAGGDAEVLMGPMSQTLLAISAGAVFMGVVGLLAFGMGVALNALELLVAGLQAYVFAILTCVYLNDALHPAH